MYKILTLVVRLIFLQFIQNKLLGNCISINVNLLLIIFIYFYQN